jgi:molybdate transport system substrate-binding protein
MNRLVGAALMTSFAAVACAFACSKPPDAKIVTVFAAQSLEKSLRAVAAAYERETGTKVELHVAGSQVLATQLAEGARADVVTTADEQSMAALLEKKLVVSPRVLAKNKLVLAVPAASSVTSLEQALAPGTRLVIAAEKVPVGNYARALLKAAGKLEAALPLIVSNEESVAGVVTKVTLGEADAGFVYSTDVATSGGKLRSVQLPAAASIDVVYPIAAVAEPAHAGAAEPFLSFVMGPGHALLAEAGFLAP